MENTQDLKNFRTPLSEKMDTLKSEGYDKNFVFKKDTLYLQDTENSFAASDLKQIREFRFEGESNPGDMSILYAIETSDGTKGTISNAYGTYADNGLENYLKQAEEKGAKTQFN
ncbi:hypothetical protein AB9P05_12545 [Roseivirga sp. BDSF3-8]|uniref:hypothetical protein n=1 Tax=Roseivirga sp. BDSF3-8 TaxID=3241598 RepID=UPI003532792D